MKKSEKYIRVYSTATNTTKLFKRGADTVNGTQAYNDRYDGMAKNIIKANPDKRYLSGFYYYLLSDMSYSAAYGYLTCVVHFIDYESISDPKSITLDNYTKYIAATKTKSSSYKIMIHSALKKFSNFLKANGYCEDYMQFIKRPKHKETIETKKKREIGYLTKDEIKIFIDTVKNSDKKEEWKIRDIAIVLLLLNTGIRRSALQKLDVSDYNPKDNTITVLEKGEVSRVIYISDSVAEAIEDWLWCRKSIVNDDKEPGLFLSNHKIRITAQTIYNIIKEYGKVIQGKNIAPHKLRSTYGTQLYDKTHDVYFVQQCMGHSNPKTTEMYIRGQKQNTSKRAADIMDDFL